LIVDLFRDEKVDYADALQASANKPGYHKWTEMTMAGAAAEPISSAQSRSGSARYTHWSPGFLGLGRVAFKPKINLLMSQAEAGRHPWY